MVTVLHYDGQRAEPPLDDVRDFLRRFVAYPSDAAAIAHTLWIAHCHLMGAWDSTPRIAFLSPEPNSGKTRALEASELLVPNAVEAVNVTPAYLFRKIGEEEGGRPTILYDEIDTVFGPKAKDNEEIRGLLNAGHRHGAVAGRCVVRGATVVTEEIPAFCAVALAGLGNLPETLISRSVVIRMRRRAPGESVEPFRRRIHVEEGHRLRDQLTDWGESVVDSITDVWPVMPAGIEDRDADVWESLLAVADAAGGDWSQQARNAAVTLVTESKQSSPSLGVRLLADLQQVFGDKPTRSTVDILAGLHAMDEAPWGDLRGKPLDARGLSSRVRPYNIKPKPIRIGDQVVKGYEATDLIDAWRRYLPQGQKSVTSVTPVTGGKLPPDADCKRVTDVTDVTGVTVSGQGDPEADDDIEREAIMAEGNVGAAYLPDPNITEAELPPTDYQKAGGLTHGK